MTTHPARPRHGLPVYRPIKVRNLNVAKLLHDTTRLLASELVTQLEQQYDRFVADYLAQRDRRSAVVAGSSEGLLEMDEYLSSKWLTKTGQVAVVLLTSYPDLVSPQIRFLVDFLGSNVRINSKVASELLKAIDLLEDPMESFRVRFSGQSLTGYDFGDLPLPLRISDPWKQARPRRKVYRRGYNDKGTLASVSDKAIKSANRVAAELVERADEDAALASVFFEERSFDEIVTEISRETGRSTDQVRTELQTRPTSRPRG